MVSKIILILLLSSSLAYAEIPYVKIDDVKTHEQVANKLNEIISDINNESKKRDIDKKSIIKTQQNHLNSFSKLVAIAKQKSLVGSHSEVNP